MAGELRFTGSLSFFKPSIMASAVGRSINDYVGNVGGNFWNEGTMLVNVGATAIPLGQMTSPHWCYFKNLDATRVINIRNGSVGTDLIGLLPGEPAFVPLLFTAVPFAVAPQGACLLEYLIIGL